MDRFAAADLLREVTTERFGSVDAAVAAGEDVPDGVELWWRSGRDVTTQRRR
jgi:plasmid stability protein